MLSTMMRKILGVALLLSLMGSRQVEVLAAPTSVEQGAPLLWVQNGELSRQAQEMLAVLRRVEDFGLAPRDFEPMLTAIESENRRAANPMLLDQLTNAAARRLIDQLHGGRVDPHAAGYALSRRRTPLDDDAALRLLATADDVTRVLATFEPQSAQYRALKQALAQYRLVPPEFAVLTPPGGASVRQGEAYPAAGKLRRLLAALGDMPGSHGDSSASETDLDGDLAAGIARFQERNGLQADGVLGPRTHAALTVPIGRRTRQIELALERWRWLPDITAPAVIVNVPQFMLYTLADPSQNSAETRVFKMPVIVGQSVRQTPIFDSAIEAVTFRPFWNVPESIVREELLPAIARDVGYLERHEMEIVRGAGDDAVVLPANAASVAALRTGKARLRQRPGTANALGLIKFVLPNPYAVYLHSTPEKSLFARERRALSHGCIRVSDAAGLAAYLLKNTPGDWNADTIEAATCADKTVTVRLATPVPVFILYGTVVIDSDGTTMFFDDVYGYDRKLEAMLARSR